MKIVTAVFQKIAILCFVAHLEDPCIRSWIVQIRGQLTYDESTLEYRM
jgi:hypothetical protein